MRTRLWPTFLVLALALATSSQAASTIQFTTSLFTVAENDGAAIITVERLDDSETIVSVDYTSTNATATAGADYVEVAGTLTFAAGETNQTFSVTILNDADVEGAESFGLLLSNPTGGAALSSRTAASVRIDDNDRGLEFEYRDYSEREDAGSALVGVLRGDDVELGAFTVDCATIDDTAKAGQHYTASSGTLAFAAAETVMTLSVPILYREEAEPSRSFRLQLSNPSGDAVLGTRTSATVTVLDMTGAPRHGFEGLEVRSDQSVRLTLTGGVQKRFAPYFDLYPIEVSTDLMNRTPLVTLQRTNSATNDLIYTDLDAAKANQRFYRISANRWVTPALQPTGPYAVGVIDRVLTDPSRRNRYGISRNSTFMATVWYPAQPTAGALPSPIIDPGFVGPVGLEPHVALDVVAGFVIHASRGCRVATNQATYPVLLYSCGGTDTRTDSSILAAELASHGYLVVSADHEDSVVTRLPDGRLAYGTIPLDRVDTIPHLQSRFQDVMIVLAELDKMNATDEVFRGTTRVGPDRRSWLLEWRGDGGSAWLG